MTTVKAAKSSFLSKLFNKKEEPIKVLKFSDQEVTFAVQEGRHVFEWDGTKGSIGEYFLNPIAGEWTLKIIPLGSDGKHGFVSASPTGRRTLTIHKAARIATIVKMGFTEQFARIYISRSRNCRHNQLKDVIEWVGRNYLMPQETLDKLCLSRSVVAEAHILCDDVVSLSQTRMFTALEIIRSMRHDDRVLQYIAANLPAMQEELHDTGVSHNEAIYESLSTEDHIAANYLAVTYPDRRR